MAFLSALAPSEEAFAPEWTWCAERVVLKNFRARDGSKTRRAEWWLSQHAPKTYLSWLGALVTGDTSYHDQMEFGRFLHVWKCPDIIPLAHIQWLPLRTTV